MRRRKRRPIRRTAEELAVDAECERVRKLAPPGHVVVVRADSHPDGTLTYTVHSESREEWEKEPDYPHA